MARLERRECFLRSRTRDASSNSYAKKENSRKNSALQASMTESRLLSENRGLVFAQSFDEGGARQTE
jgi:hypothetical protein